MSWLSKVRWVGWVRRSGAHPRAQRAVVPCTHDGPAHGIQQRHCADSAHVTLKAGLAAEGRGRLARGGYSPEADGAVHGPRGKAAVAEPAEGGDPIGVTFREGEGTSRYGR